MGTFFTKLKLFFHKVSFIINTLFPPFQEMLYAGHLKLYAEVSEHLTHALFQLIVTWKMECLNSILHGTKKGKSEITKSGL